MNKKQMIKHIELARNNVKRRITAHASRGRIAAGLASEGYNGGYRDALDDMILLLNDVIPNRNYWWEDEF